MNNKQNTDNKLKYLIIPAAGLGTRMKSVNADLPKELLPVGSKPAIQYAVEEGLSAGIREVIIIISTQKEIVRNYFEDETVRRSLYSGTTDEMNEILRDVSFHFLYQKNPLGEADAISYAEEIAGNHASAVMYPDNICVPFPGVIKTIKSVYEKLQQDVIALSEVPDEVAPTISNAGRVDTAPLEQRLFTIERFIPKGEGHFIPRFNNETRATGIYICGPHIFEYIKKARGMTQERELTDTPVRNAMLKERRILGFKVRGIVYDIGNPEGYAACLHAVQGRQPHSNE